MKRFLFATLLYFGLTGIPYGQSDSPFKLEKVVDAFEQMKKAPGFDSSGPLQWSYFFISAMRSPLSEISNKLEANGYQYIKEYRGDDGKFWLHVAKTEIHTPKSLHQRNGELFQFAKRYSGVVYDGWDVTRSTK
jgi:Regulator of ribonuclease activity B